MSSPLALRQSTLSLPAPWGLHNDNLLPNPYPFGTQQLDFCQFRMQKSSSDYFTHRPARGSSPTATLAADLSQNCFIDRSPKPATPRRNIFKNALHGMVSKREGLTTPPILSSSPAPDSDAMDISPLPHKALFTTRVAHINVQSPTPEPTPTTEDVAAPSTIPLPGVPQPAKPTFLESIRPIAPLERRKNSLLRPSLAQAKHYSTNTISLGMDTKETIRPRSQDKLLPPFPFGSEDTKQAGSDEMDSSDYAAAAPKLGHKTAEFSLASLVPSRSRPNFQRQLSNSTNMSPGNSGMRRTTGVPTRPRKHMRRCLSLFEHPERFVLEQKKEQLPDGKLDLIRDFEEPDTLQLPHFFKQDQSESVPRISQETMMQVLNGAYNCTFPRTLVVDCRFEYEYKGGHIDGALNFNDKELLAKKLFETSQEGKTLVILHCEYSQFRAPISASHIRQEDRKVNAFQYPKLSYPDVYILDGGYSAFFTANRTRCVPPAYIQMVAKDHEHACERGMGKVQRKKLNRAQPSAFGQHSPMNMDVNMDVSMADSPSCIGRSFSIGTKAMEFTTNEDSGLKRFGFNRRIPTL